MSENENTETSEEEYQTLLGGLVVGGFLGFLIGVMFVLSIVGLWSIFK